MLNLGLISSQISGRPDRFAFSLSDRWHGRVRDGIGATEARRDRGYAGADQIADMGTVWIEDAAVLTESAEDALRHRLRDLTPNVVCVLHSPISANCAALRTATQLVSAWAHHQKSKELEVIVLPLGRAFDEGSDFKGLFRDSRLSNALPFVVDAAQAATAISALDAVLGEIAERFSDAPAVGIGVLLVNKKGSFLMGERVAPGGEVQFGTIGGRLQVSMGLEENLRQYVMETVAIDERGLEIGPLLACTNMTASNPEAAHVNRHYVDLTFFAFCDEEPPRVRDETRFRVHKTRSGARKLWFSFDEMRQYYEQRKLFVPVAHAFECLCGISVQQVISPGSTPMLSHGFRSPGLGTFAETIDGRELVRMIEVCAGQKRRGASPIFFEV